MLSFKHPCGAIGFVAPFICDFPWTLSNDSIMFITKNNGKFRNGVSMGGNPYLGSVEKVAKKTLTKRDGAYVWFLETFVRFRNGFRFTGVLSPRGKL